GIVGNNVRVWETKTSSLAMNVSLDESPRDADFRRLSLAISQNGEFIDFTDDDSLHIYRIKNGEEVFSETRSKLTHRLGANYLALGTDEATEGPLVRVFDLRDSDATTKRIPKARWLTPRLVQQLAFDRDETKLASVSGNQVTVWDPTTGREITRVGH